MKLHALAAIAALPLLGACWIDLSDLTGHPRDAGAAGGGTTSTTGVGTGGGTGVLDCAPCPVGGCTATAVANGQDAQGPDGIAVDGEALYWVNRSGGTVMRLGAGGGAPQVLAQAVGPVAVAVSGGYVVWAAQDGVYGCNVAGCAGSKTLIAGAGLMGSIQDVAYDGQYVYYTDQAGGPTTGRAMRCPTAAGCPGGVMLGGGLDMPAGIALYGTLVFWTEQANGNQNGNVDQAPKGGGNEARIASALQLPAAVAADGLSVYWTESDPAAGKVRSCPYGAGYCNTPVDLAVGLAAPLDVGLAGGRVYWTEAGDGRVLSCPTTGCGNGMPRVHASGRTGLRRLALGASCVFWTDDQGGGSVSKAPR